MVSNCTAACIDKNMHEQVLQAMDHLDRAISKLEEFLAGLNGTPLEAQKQGGVPPVCLVSIWRSIPERITDRADKIETLATQLTNSLY